MIKFFRKIRQKMIKENKFSKYLLYAIGEIVLVVIGILIALQINNWNEGKKNVKKGHEILADVRENAESNIIQFQQDIEVNRKVVNSIDIVLYNITITKIYDDSLGKHLRFVTWWASSRWKSTGYETLVSQGVEIVKSKVLRESIIDLYETTYPLIIENTRLEEGNWHAVLPYWLEFIYREPTDFTAADQHKATPFDYQKLVQSNMFKSILSFKRSQRLVDIQLRNTAIEKNRKLIELIDKELIIK